MAIDNIQLVRRRIGDARKDNIERFAITPEANTFALAFENATVDSVYDTGLGQLIEDTGYTMGAAPNELVLLYEGDEGNELVVTYHYYAFTYDELSELVTSYGVNGACVEAVRWLIADSARLHDYSRGATSENLSQVIKNLQSMLKDYIALGDTEDGSPVADMKILKRTNKYYNGKRELRTDLSRDDSLSL